MNYNIWFELTSLFFLTFIALRFFVSTRFPARKNVHFGVYIILAWMAVAFNLIGCWTLNHSASVPLWLNVAVNEAVFLLQFAMVFSLANYVLLISGWMDARHRKLSTVLALFDVIFLLCIFINIWTGWLFYFDSDLNYLHGPLFILYYVPFIGYLLFISWVSYINRSKMDIMAESVMIPAFCAIVIVCMAIQYFIPEVLLTGFSIVLGSTMVFLNLQNPSNDLDSLTKAYSRNLFSRYAGELISRHRSYPVIIADIVGISTINKTFGESFGNAMIIKVANILKSLNKNDFVFRYGGNCFLIILRNQQELEDYKTRLLVALSKPVQIRNQTTLIRLRMCSYTQMDMEDSSESLTRTIQLAIKQMKSNKANQIFPVPDSLIINSQKSSAIEKALRKAIQTNSVEIYLQPVIDLKTGRISAAEALARIRDPELGMISPTDFIPIAEETGLISSLSLQVVNQTCIFLKSIPPDGFQDFKWVSVNLSVSDCLSKAQGEKICSIITGYGIDPRRICFEITETMTTIEKGLPENLKILTEKGYTLALDDFGTEFANIDSALRLPFSIAKLDRSVVHIDNGGNRMKILKAMVDVFSDLHLDTVAEGVDSREMVEIARTAGVRYLQGFYFAQPLPVRVFSDYLKNNLMSVSSKEGTK